MTLKEMMKMLVETESQDERFNLVEENQDLMAGETEPDQDILAQLDSLTAQLDETVAALEEQKKKYRDTFFSGSEKEDTPETEEDEEEVKSLDDLGM